MGCLYNRLGCPPSKLISVGKRDTRSPTEGKVKVYPDGSDEAVEIGTSDSKGASCTWDVSEAIDKHYNILFLVYHLQV